MRFEFWTEDKIARAEKLWNDGISARAIAEMFGSKKNTVINMARRHRHRFPSRQDARQPLPEAGGETRAPIRHPDRVTRVTISGAHVTMPRVPCIDGYAEP